MKRSVFRQMACFVLLCYLMVSMCSCGDVEHAAEDTATTTVTTESSATTTTVELSANDTSATTEEVTTVTTLTTTTATTTAAPTTTATATTTTTKAPTTTTTAAPQKEWELFWSDEFDGDSLDMTKWNIERGTNGPVVKKAENVKVEDGDCVITLRRDNPADGYEYSSSYVTTANKFSFCFGRLEFRAKLPVGQGVWPALWTLGDNYLTIGNDEKAWPLCGEIDVMELIGSSDPHNPFDNKKILGTLHWGHDRDNHKQAHNSWFLVDSPADDYHIYAVEWDENEMVWYVDEKAYLRVKMDDPTMGTAFMQKHWIIMNIGLCNWDGSSYDETTPDTASMYVDYVRVYKEKK